LAEAVTHAKRTAGSRAPMQRTNRSTLFLIIALSLAAVIFFLNRFADEKRRIDSHTRAITPRGSLAEFEQTTISIFNAAAPSVVYIFTENAVAGFFGAREVRQGAGSGFLWDSSGHVVTNFHVIEGARRVQVRLESGEAIDATYVGGTPDYDLAVIRLRRPLSTIQPIPVGRSDNLQVGQSVLAIGNPFGLSRTLTTGVISALDRRLPTATGRDVVGVIQTDAAINPGNSGGPLIDSGGRLIGVNTAIISGSGSSAGIGFAVPVDVVNKVVPQLIAKGKFPRPGIGIVVLDEEATASLGVVGVVIDRVVPDSEAQRAGLEGIDYRRRVLGDTIVAVEGKPITNMADFVQMMQAFDIGQPISLQVRRGDTLRDVTVTIMDISYIKGETHGSHHPPIVTHPDGRSHHATGAANETGRLAVGTGGRMFCLGSRGDHRPTVTFSQTDLLHSQYEAFYGYFWRCRRNETPSGLAAHMVSGPADHPPPANWRHGSRFAAASQPVIEPGSGTGRVVSAHPLPPSGL
jgi:2-alkenal reductase